VHEVTDEELAQAMAESVIDADGNDLALARYVAALTPEARARSEANLRAFTAELRATLRPRQPRDPAGA
jgi:hypothetical protein